jgi:uncharacterized protein YjiS (DUF1127 family)
MAKHSYGTHRTAGASGARPTLAGLLKLWEDRRTSRQALAEMPDHLLADIGVDPLEARREARKPFWRA